LVTYSDEQVFRVGYLLLVKSNTRPLQQKGFTGFLHHVQPFRRHTLHFVTDELETKLAALWTSPRQNVSLSPTMVDEVANLGGRSVVPCA